MNRVYSKRIALNKMQRERIILIRRIAVIAILFCLFFSFLSIVGKANGKEREEYKYYTSIRVEYGDTLWSIAGRYMDRQHDTRLTYMSEIKSINHIQDSGTIQEGKILIIPYYSSEYVGD